MQKQILKPTIIVLLILVIGLVAYLYFFGNKNSLPTPDKKLLTQDNEPQAEVLSSKAYEIKKSLVKTEQTDGDLVLEKNSKFEIRYLLKDDQFIVNIIETPFEDNKLDAESWFKDKGFTSKDLCLLELTFSASRHIKPDFNQVDAIPSGC